LYQQHGLQHLELNPNRLLLDGDRVLLDQFGVAQLLWLPSGVVPGQTQARYNAPERSQGLVTRSCDQYSLAVIFQDMLTGQNPFRGSSSPGTTSLRGKSLARRADLSPLTAADRPVVSRALDLDPEKRFGSCLEFLRALRATDGSSPRPVVAENDPERAGRRAQVARLVEEARQWLRLEPPDEAAAPEAPPGTRERRFFAVLPPEGALGKFDGFRRQWGARLAEHGDTFAVFHVSEKSK